MAYFCLYTSIDTAYWNVANFIELAEQTGYDPASVLPVTVFKTASPSILRTAPYKVAILEASEGNDPSTFRLTAECSAN